MKRMKTLFGNRRMMVMLTLAILVLTAAALIASSASFTAQSANVTNTFATGNLTVSGPTVSFSGKLWPGHSLDGTSGVTVTADGGTAQLWLKVTGYPVSPGVADKLTLEVLDASGSSSLIGPLPVTGAQLADGVQVATGLSSGAQSYTFRVNFPDGDTGATLADKGADDPYKNTTADISFQWVAVSE